MTKGIFMNRFLCILILVVSAFFCCLTGIYAENVSADISAGGCFKTLYHMQQSDVHGSTDTFSIATAVIRADGNFGKYYRVGLELELKSRELWDAYIENAQFDDYGVRFGQFTVPFGLELYKTEWRMDFVQRPYGLRELFFNYSNARDIGLMARARTEYVEVDAAFVNGNGWEGEDDDRRKTPAGRLLFKYKSVTLGGSFYQGSYFDGYIRDRNRLGANLILKGEADSLEAEYYYGRDDKTRKYGWYVQGVMGVPFMSPQAYFYVPVKGVFRIEYWDPDKDIKENEINIFTFGIKYTPFDHFAFELNYEHHTEEPKIKNDEFLAQARVSF